VVIVLVAETADGGGAVGARGQQGEVLAVNHSGQAGLHHAKFAAEFHGAVRLGIEGVNMAGGTSLENEDDRFGPGFYRGGIAKRGQPHGQEA